MYPVLFKVGPITIYSFGFFITLAYMLGTFVFWREGKKQGYNEEKLLDLSVIGLISALVGARFYHVALNYSLFSHDPLSVLYFWQGGLAYHGALAAVFLIGLIVTAKWKWPFFQIADIAALSASLALSTGKIGAFFAGFDFGKLTTVPWSVSLPSLVGQRHPVQLYEALGYFLLFIILYVFYFRNLSSLRLKSGKVFFAFLIASSLIRAFSEFFRAEIVLIGPLPLAVLNSFLVVLVSLFALYYFRLRNFRDDIRMILKSSLVVNEKVLKRFKI